MKTILVTGGAGFIGSHLCERLVERGDRVICLDSLVPTYDVALKERNLVTLQGYPRFTFAHADILDGPALKEIIKNHQVTDLVHLAALAGVRPSLDNPVRYNEINVCGSLSVLDAARCCGLPSVILASSSSVYGANTKSPFHEDDPVCRPVSPYAASKRAMELNASVYHALYGMDILCLRFFTAYGPRQRPDMAISRFVRSVREGQELELYGDGTSIRDYTYVDDVVRALLLSVDRAQGMGYQLINVGSGQAVELRTLIELVAVAVGREPVLRNVPKQQGDVELTHADIRKAKRLLGYSPQTSLINGLQSYVTWVSEQNNRPL